MDVTAGTGNASTRLEYSNTCGEIQSAGVGDIMYSTCHTGNYFTATFTSVSGNITAFSVSGTVQSRGVTGTVVGGSLNRSGTSNYFGFYKMLHDGNLAAEEDDEDSSAPTVNHLVVVPSSNWSQNFSTDAGSDADSFLGPGVSTLTYVLFGGHPLLQLDELHNENDFSSLMDKVVAFTEAGSVCQVLTGRVCACDASKGACTDDPIRYTVVGPEFGPISQGTVSTSIAPTPPPAASGSSSEVSPGAVAGIVIAALLILVVAVLVVVVVIEKRNARRKQATPAMFGEPDIL